MLITLTLISTIIGFLATFKVLNFKSKPVTFSHRPLGISILKPIRGLEPQLMLNLHSFFNLSDKIPFEIIFCVKNSEDPCVSIVNDLISLHPHVNAKLFLNAPDFGKNPKVSNMHVAWDRAAYDLILISDSNVRVKPNYLELLMAQRQKGAGLVTQAVYGAGATTVGGHLDVVHLNSFYLKATAFLNLVGITCVLGKCMLFSRYQFNRLGGLFAVKNYLAEDLVAGEMMAEAGYKITLMPELLRQTTVMQGFKTYWYRHVRWARLRKCHVLHGYVLEPLLFETIWPVLLFVFAVNNVQRAVSIGCLVVQILTNISLYAFKFNDKESWRSFPWFWLKDILGPVIWLSGLASNQVNWRGQILHLRFGGKLGTKYLRAAKARKRLRASLPSKQVAT